MSPRQHKAFYLKHWTLCARANGWNNQKAIWGESRAAVGPLDAELLGMVRAAALSLAQREHRGERPNDFRHACTIVAVGKNKSSLELTNDECQRIVDLFRVLTEPDNLTYVAHWEDPELAKKENLIAAAQRKAPGAYIERIMVDKFHTRDIESLTVKQLKSLCFTLNERRDQWATPVIPDPDPDPEPEEVF